MRSTISTYRDEFGKIFVLQYLFVQLLFIILWLIGLGNRPLQFPAKAFLNNEHDDEAIIFNMPVLRITGENDRCIDTHLFDFHINENKDRVYPRGYTLLRVPNARHFLFSEKPVIIA